MKLSEKIYCCRKRIGKSQEALAEQLGVSRQAISKWETGDAEPEISKIRLLAVTFDVTTDWLLSEEGPEEEQVNESEPKQSADRKNWVESVPGTVGKIGRKYGWLFGVHLSVGGAVTTIMGFLMYYLPKAMLSGFIDEKPSNWEGLVPDGTIIHDLTGNQMDDSFLNFANNNPVSIMGMFVMGLGIVTLIVGVVLTIMLKRKSKELQKM